MWLAQRRWGMLKQSHQKTAATLTPERLETSETRKSVQNYQKELSATRSVSPLKQSHQLCGMLTQSQQNELFKKSLQKKKKKQKDCCKLHTPEKMPKHIRKGSHPHSHTQLWGILSHTRKTMTTNLKTKHSLKQQQQQKHITSERAASANKQTKTPSTTVTVQKMPKHIRKSSHLLSHTRKNKNRKIKKIKRKKERRSYIRKRCANRYTEKNNQPTCHNSYGRIDVQTHQKELSPSHTTQTVKQTLGEWSNSHTRKATTTKLQQQLHQKRCTNTAQRPLNCSTNHSN